MLSPRWQKILSDLWLNKARTLLVILSIAVGVFAIGTIVTTRIIITRDLAATYAERNPSDAVLYMDRVDNALLSVVRRMPEVAEAAPRRSVYGKLRASGADDWVDISLVVLPDYTNQQLDIITLEAGAWPERRDEIVMERSSLDFAGVSLGDEVLVETPLGRQYALRVVGVAHDMGRTDAAFYNEATGYLNARAVQWMGLPDGYNELFLTFTGTASSQEHNRRAAQAVRERLAREGVSVYWDYIAEPGKHPAASTIEALTLVLAAMSVFALVLSSFLIVNVITAILARHKRQIGIMKAFGARDGQVVRMYFSLVLVFGVLALVIALPLGVVGARWLTTFVADTVNFDIVSFDLLPEVLAIQVLVALIVPVIAGLYPIIAGTRVTVREAINDYGIGSPGSETALLPRIFARLTFLPRPFLISLGNTFRRTGRLTLTLFTLTLAGAIFVSVFSVRDSMTLTLQDALAYWDYDVTLELGGSYDRRRVEREVWRIEGITAVESWRSAGGYRVRPDGSEGFWLTIYDVPAETDMITPIMVEGRWLRPDDGNAIVINTGYLEQEPDIRVGDDLVLRLKGRDRPFRVVGIAQALLVGPLAYTNQPYLATTINEPRTVDRVLIETREDTPAYRAAIAEEVGMHMRRAGMIGASTFTFDTAISQIQYQFNILLVVLLIMVALLTLVGGLGLTGTVAINVLERTRELGVMRAIGATGATIRGIVMAEAVIIGVISWALGFVLALPVSRPLSDMIGMAFLGTPLRYTFSTDGGLIWLGVTVVLCILASFVPAYRASRMSVAEVLVYE